MDHRLGTSDAPINSTRVSDKLGLVDEHVAWLAELNEARSPARIAALDAASLSRWMTRLGIAPEDADEVLRTMPSAEHDPELWWLVERSHHILVRALANHENEPEWEPLPRLPAALRLFPVYLILVSLPAIRERQQSFGVPDDISWETLSLLGRAMTVYRKNHGQAGVSLTGWEWLRFFAWLYQVGRLEVTPYWLRTHPQIAGPLFWYGDETAQRLGPGLKKGAAALSLHIPATDPLTPEACDDSFRRMRTAFEKLQPCGPPCIATCTSWTLDEQLAEYLPADSNILSFQRRFTVVPGARDNDDWILNSVFGSERPKELHALPQRTTLERAVVEHLRQGRHWRMRTGWLRLTG